MKTLLLLRQDSMGYGDPDLGARVLKTFLQKSIALHDLDTIAFYNSGVKLVAPGSPVLGELTLLEERGIDLVPCGTCLTHFEVEPAAGNIGSMDDIVAAMGKADKVITL